MTNCHAGVTIPSAPPVGQVEPVVLVGGLHGSDLAVMGPSEVVAPAQQFKPPRHVFRDAERLVVVVRRINRLRVLLAVAQPGEIVQPAAQSLAGERISDTLLDWVASRFELSPQGDNSRRREKLTWSHHAEAEVGT